MKIKAVLFDLDGTLLPMDQEKFTKCYFSLLAKKLIPHGYNPETLMPAIWQGVKAMVMNDGSCKNEDAFWKKFCEIFGEKARDDEPIFAEFYKNEFGEVQQSCGYNPNAAKVVELVKQKGFKAVLATNPIFPAVATEHRIRWAGLDKNVFEFYTTYENSYHCKPNLDYYKDILSQLDMKPEECLMVGNDVSEDMVAENLGLNVFLLTDCIINKDDTDISKYPQGSFEDLIKYIESL